MLSINTNLSSIIAQNSMKTSTDKLNQAIERMTTGAKINHAKDNAANYSISTNMTTKLGAYQVAEDNVAMGMDMLNVAFSSIGSISESIARIRELAIQEANGVYDEKSKKAINEEVNARIDEIERTLSTTEYNGVKFGGHEEDSKFIHDIDRRDVSKFKTFATVKEDEVLASGIFSIKTASELEKLATMTNNGLIGEGVEFVLGADIDLSGYDDWVPIGNATNKFNGIFDGNGYTISNLSIKTGANRLGLFGRVAKAEIKNVALEFVNIVMNGATADNKHVGGLVGYLGEGSTMQNCYTTGRIDARSQAKIIGGLVGQVYKDCSIDSCYSECTLINMNTMAGGLVGCLETRSTITNSYSSGDISGISAIGGLSGMVLTSSSIDKCYSTGKVTGNQSAGLVGSMHTDSSILNSWTNSIVQAKSGTSTAGLVYMAAGSVLKNVYVLNENDKHSGIIVAAYRSGGSGSIVIEDSYYSSFYDGLSIPVSAASSSSVNNVQSYSGDIPFIYDNNSKVYTYSSDIDLQVGVSSDKSSSIRVSVGYVLKGLRNLRQIGLEVGDYVNVCDLLLKDLNDKEVHFGSVYNRLESVLDEIEIQYANLASSRSTISDTDVAKESSTYIQQQILQQASATLMATANQSPSIALQLI